MYWLHPPISKIYEALGTLGDGRIEIGGDTAKVWSSSRNKFYTVAYDSKSRSIMMNDNASFYHGYLGYPGIAFLLSIGEIKYSLRVAEMLKEIRWKDLNQRFKNDFEETIEYVLSTKTDEGRREIEKEVRRIEEQLRKKHYTILGKKTRPPEGY